MDDFVKRPRRPRIDLSTPVSPARQGRPGRSIVVKYTSDQDRQPIFPKLSVRPQLALQPVEAETPQSLIELPLQADTAEASQDTQKPSEDAANDNQKPDTPKKKRRLRLPFRKPHGKKEWILVSIAAVILLGAIGGSVYWFILRPKPAPVVVTKPPEKKAEIPKPTTEASKLSGLQVPFGVNEKPVTAVMIENSPDARPQAGLKDASIIFEAIAEGGITRFNAIFQDTAPDYIGPVRSVRPYYIDWFMPFDASIAHVGGSPQGLADIRSLGAKDLDQFANGGYYTRITDRYAPHNVYTSIAKLNELEQAKGFTTANYTGFDRKKEAKLATPTAKSIDFAISSFYYNVHYDYDAATNSYLRSEGGEPHRDDRSGAQLSPKVVVAPIMGRGIASDGQHTDYQTVGSGKVLVFQDGGITEGTWTKDSRTSQWKFTDAAGKALAFNPGQTWFTILDSTNLATYKP
jgi:hypothetical protein